MRAVYERPRRAELLGARAREDVLSALSAEATGAAMRRRLEELARRTGPGAIAGSRWLSAIARSAPNPGPAARSAGRPRRPPAARPGAARARRRVPSGRSPARAGSSARSLCAPAPCPPRAGRRRLPHRASIALADRVRGHRHRNAWPEAHRDRGRVGAVPGHDHPHRPLDPGEPLRVEARRRAVPGRRRPSTSSGLLRSSSASEPVRASTAPPACTPPSRVST